MESIFIMMGCYRILRICSGGENRKCIKDGNDRRRGQINIEKELITFPI